MIKRHNKYIYAIIMATTLTSNMTFAKESENIMRSEINYKNTVTGDEHIAINYSRNATEKIDKSDLKKTIEEAKDIINKAEIGTGDGMYPKEALKELEDALSKAIEVFESSSITQSAVDTEKNDLSVVIVKFLNTENVAYKEHRDNLQKKIEECEIIYKTSVEGTKIGQYSSAALEALNTAINKANNVLNNNKDSKKYIETLDELIVALDDFKAKEISSEDIEAITIELNTALNMLEKTIKESNISDYESGITENSKIALGVMINKIKNMTKESTDIKDYKEAIRLAECVFNDFKNKTLSVDDKGNVYGRELTGKTSINVESNSKLNIVSKDEFIPNAGLPIDIKGTLGILGSILISIGAFINKKIKK